MDDDEVEFNLLSGDCVYYELTNPRLTSFTNSVIHLNIRSLRNKIPELECIINLLKYPKLIMLPETWLRMNSPFPNIDNYTFISSPRISNTHGSGVGIYIHKSLKFIIKSKSSDQDNRHYCDYIIIELYEPKLPLCSLYCFPPPEKK